VNAACLSDSDLLQLHGLASRCESHFGRGLDLEWAFAGGRLYLLQCRAMTRNR
jgi:pyruvate,water dikinase